MKKKKIKWKNVIKAVIFMFCISMILHDIFMLTIASGWTWTGFLTFILFCTIASIIYDDFEEQTKSIPSYLPKHAKDTGK